MCNVLCAIANVDLLWKFSPQARPYISMRDVSTHIIMAEQTDQTQMQVSNVPTSQIIAVHCTEANRFIILGRGDLIVKISSHQ
jgi:hypothetical protein